MTQERSPFNAQEEPARLLDLNTAPWNKLFRAELLKQMPDLQKPPPIFEDVMMHLLLYPSAGRIAFVAEPLVNYVVRENSIMTSISESQIESTYVALSEVKRIDGAGGATPRMMDLIDAEAFLHLGVSLMFRISYDPKANLKQVLKENRTMLDADFPSWNTSCIISFKHALQYRGANLKVWLARIVYRCHLMGAALGAYRFAIEKLGKDIKW